VEVTIKTGRQASLVLIHGGAHTAACWDLVINEIASRAADLPVLAIDLPGRSSPAGQRAGVTIDLYAESVISAVERAGLDDIVLVGHSLAGLTLPRVAAGLGPRVREMIFIAAFTPAHGFTVLDTLPPPLAAFLGRAARTGNAFALPVPVARVAFWNGLSPQRRRFARSTLCREPAGPLLEPADYSGVSAATPRTWIVTRRDRVVSPRRQRAYIAGMGGVETVLSIDSCHDAMFSHPAWLAELFIKRCSRGTPQLASHGKSSAPRRT
jgi:pimeloyl-ACP methyl ester carboxylesterase